MAKSQKHVRKPNKKYRYFSEGLRYEEIVWSDWGEVIDAWAERIQQWYIRPCRELLRLEGTPSSKVSGSFAAVGVCSLLIDTLMQFSKGIPNSSKKEYKDWLRTLENPDGSSAGFDEPFEPKEDSQIKDVADAFYSGVRCGILHEAHATTYAIICVMDGQSAVWVSDEEYTMDKTETTVAVNPEVLLDLLSYQFDKYVDALRAQTNATLLRNFKTKFETSHGMPDELPNV